MRKRQFFIPLIMCLFGALMFASCDSDDDDDDDVLNNRTDFITNVNGGTQRVSTVPLVDATSDNLNEHIFTNAVNISLNGTSATVTGNASGVTVTQNGEAINISSTAPNVEYVLSGNYTGSINLVSTQPAKVTLNGVAIRTNLGVALNLAAPKAFIVSNSGTTNSFVARPNFLGTSVIYNSGKLAFEGTGILSVDAQAYDAIFSLGGLTAKETTFNITSVLDGIKTRDNAITLNGGVYNIRTMGRGIRTISSSSAYATRRSMQNIVINDGVYTINATGSDGEGIKSYASLAINGGTIWVNAYDDAFSANVDMVITGGSLYGRSAASDAFDSNGTIHVSGGTAIGVAVNPANVAFDCDNNEFIVTGGTLIGLGSNNLSIPTYGSTQPTIILGRNNAFNRYGPTLLNIQSNTGTEVLTYQIPQSYTSLFISSPNLLPNTNYTIYTGGTTTGTEINGLYTGGVYNRGASRTTFTTAITTPFFTSL